MPIPFWRKRHKKSERTLREKIRIMRYALRFLALIWQTNPKYALIMAILRLTRAFVPVSTLWVAKLIIDVVVQAQRTQPDYQYLWKLVVLEIAIVVTGELLARASALVESLLGDQFSNFTSIKLMKHAATLDLYQFENPKFYDQLERARRQTTGRIYLLAQMFGMAQDGITLASLGTALFLFSPLLLGLLIVAVLPSFWGELRFASLEYSLFYKWTPQRRQLDYIRFMGASDETAKEVQMFGLAPWLIERFRRLADRFYDENRKLAVRKAVVSSGLSIFGTLGYYAAFALILIRTVRGDMTVGSLTFLAASFARSRDLIRGILLGASDLYEQSLYLKDLFDFFEMRPSITSPPGAPPVPHRIREGFLFEDVGFRYPGSDRWAVRHASFRIRPGERIALVGENGAGKTTLTKLLARLYDPTEGRILLDGRDLREYDLASVRHNIGVIFQDFVEYDLRFDENIGVGEIDRVQTYFLSVGDGIQVEKDEKPGPDVTVPDEIVSAADKSLAATLLGRFAHGFRQMLGYRFESGVQLSGGEWQKVALARAYIRDAQVLILDEPTASLDARAEYEVFVRFSELVAGRMAVIISHRFSTVRMADHIIVLNEGHVVEEGTHKELVDRRGLYAELFSLQAKGYQ